MSEKQYPPVPFFKLVDVLEEAAHIADEQKAKQYVVGIGDYFIVSNAAPFIAETIKPTTKRGESNES